MSTIDIRHPHTLPPPQARQAVEDFAVKLGQRFGLDYRWEGDVLHFKRSGVDGRIALLPGELYPELSVGGIQKYEGADFPDAPFEVGIKKAPGRRG